MKWQGDQIGRTFAHYMIVFYGQFFLITEEVHSPHFWDTIFHSYGCALIITIK
jgi:hypothetical protein